MHCKNCNYMVYDTDERCPTCSLSSQESTADMLMDKLVWLRSEILTADRRDLKARVEECLEIALRMPCDSLASPSSESTHSSDGTAAARSEKRS